MLLRNVSGSKVDFLLHGHGRIRVAPGEDVEVEDAYCLPRRGENPNTPIPSIMSLLCPQLKPVDDREIQAKVQELEKTKTRIRTSAVPDYDDLIKAGVAPKRAMAKIAAAEAKKQLAEDAANGEE